MVIMKKLKFVRSLYPIRFLSFLTKKRRSFLKYSNKKIKNPKGYFAINKGVNCNSPVWKNKPRCS